jgi:hypothetical protein
VEESGVVEAGAAWRVGKFWGAEEGVAFCGDAGAGADAAGVEDAAGEDVSPEDAFGEFAEGEAAAGVAAAGSEFEGAGDEEEVGDGEADGEVVELSGLATSVLAAGGLAVPDPRKGKP